VLCRRDEVSEVYHSPLLDLVYAAAGVHRMHNDPSMVRASRRAQRWRARGCPVRLRHAHTILVVPVARRVF